MTICTSQIWYNDNADDDDDKLRVIKSILLLSNIRSLHDINVLLY